MNKDYTLQDLSKLLVEFGRKKYGSDYAHPHALGTIVGLADFYLSNFPDRLQGAINARYSETEKELAAL